jgi:hypothetical protein
MLFLDILFIPGFQSPDRRWRLIGDETLIMNMRKPALEEDNKSCPIQLFGKFPNDRVNCIPGLSKL